MRILEEIEKTPETSVLSELKTELRLPTTIKCCNDDCCGCLSTDFTDGIFIFICNECGTEQGRGTFSKESFNEVKIICWDTWHEKYSHCDLSVIDKECPTCGFKHFSEIADNFVCRKCDVEKDMEQVAIKHGGGDLECIDCYADSMQM